MTHRDELLPWLTLTTLAVVAGAGCPMAMDCVDNTDCMSGTHCVSGACMDAAAAPEAEPPPDAVEEIPAPTIDAPTIDALDIAGADLVPGSTPRLFVQGGGVVVYFLRAPCGELVRALPLFGAVEVIASPDAGTCFAELDAVRTADGTVHAVIRQTIGEGSAAVTLAIDEAGLVGAPTSFAPVNAADRRGLVPRAALDTAGAAHAVWGHGHAGVVDVERIALPAVDEPTFVTALASYPAGLALAFDAGGAAAVFSLDIASFVERLRATYFAERVITNPESRGAIDATTCGGTVYSAFRQGDRVRVALVTPDPPAALHFIDAALAEQRAAGDIAVACDAGSVWAAHTSNGTLRLYPHADAPAPAILNIGDADGAVSLVVVDGTAHLAWATAEGARYATVTP